jgi:hypothetical protein
MLRNGIRLSRRHYNHFQAFLSTGSLGRFSACGGWRRETTGF